MRKVEFKIAMIVKCNDACPLSEKWQLELGHDPDVICLDCILDQH